MGMMRTGTAEKRYRTSGSDNLEDGLAHEVPVVADTVITNGEVVMMTLPPGEVDVDISLGKNVIDVNLGRVATNMAVNSDKRLDVIAPPNSFAFYRNTSQLKLRTTNFEPVLLLELSDEALADWMDDWQHQLDLSGRKEFYQRDDQMASLARIALSTMEAGAFGNLTADALMAEALVTGMVARMLSSFSGRHAAEAADGAGRTNRRHRARIANAIDYAMDHFRDPDLKIGDMAAIANLSPPHFNEVFKQEKRITPYGFILKKRLDEAHRLLAATDLSIADIAFACGFSSQAHMSTQFKKTFRITPSKLRNS
ncbi:AraC family transcriptional regulator [uncultured Tateyamaria sp.]|uniref:helix-turn-helix domain-containing protein n=1 Tax=uncultured Tateyamaria sp. TaxID=455651 RepID=UPI002612EC2C|nr:AraC family transcriptional regulator [uncultured Tateyamaria sp.]